MDFGIGCRISQLHYFFATGIFFDNPDLYNTYGGFKTTLDYDWIPDDSCGHTGGDLGTAANRSIGLECADRLVQVF